VRSNITRVLSKGKKKKRPSFEYGVLILVLKSKKKDNIDKKGSFRVQLAGGTKNIIVILGQTVSLIAKLNI